MFLAAFLNKFITTGELTVITADGKTHLYKGARAGPSVTIKLHSKKIEFRLALNPDLACGEGYMDGALTVEDGTLYDFLDLIGRNWAVSGEGLGTNFHRAMAWIGRLFRSLHQFNPIHRSKANVAHHYDLSGRLYDLFLDSDRQYSCAYFPTGNEGLDEAQEYKKKHIAAKLLLKGGQKVLDIGSGWGGMALTLAREWGCDVTGITLSQEQLALSRQRTKDEGLAGHVEFHLRDYRHQEGVFDRIVSVGMFEHVGVRHFGDYFGQIKNLLRDDGIALLHTIGRVRGPTTSSAWTRKYSFPGGYMPALSEIMAAVEKSGLIVTDTEVLRIHYAMTLRKWRQRFLKNRQAAVELYDERFARMWEYYLCVSEVAFRHMGLVVFQIQMAKRQDAVPLTRDYIEERERGEEQTVSADQPKSAGKRPAQRPRRKAPPGREEIFAQRASQTESTTFSTTS